MSTDERNALKTSRRMRRGFVALAAVVGSLMAVSAAPAMASLHWSDTTHGIKVAGALTVSEFGHTSKTCSAPATQKSVFVSQTAGQVWSPNLAENQTLTFSCTGGGILEMLFAFNATSTTKVSIWGSGTRTAPWENTYTQSFGTAVGDFTNGSGGTSSTMAFSSDEIGAESGHPLTVSGTLTVTTSTGGLLTLVP
jgi:hypothetical protein